MNMTQKHRHPRRTTTATRLPLPLPMPRWAVEIVMSDGSKGCHEGPYEDAFLALTVAKMSFPEAVRISVKKASHV